MKINHFEVGKDSTFIIAEIGNNHNGSFDRAIEMINEAIKFGADCVKFQMRNMSSVYRKNSLTKKAEDLGTEYILDLLEKFELSKDEHFQLSKYCSDNNIIYMCTPWDIDSVDVLESFKVPAYKVSSADLTNTPLIERLIATKKPLIFSTGMSTSSEIQKTVNFVNKSASDFALLHCNSTYPAPIRDINLNWINRLKDIHNLIGYSGHERGINVSLAAVAMGAKIIERHFTLDREMEGPDHAASLDKNQFKDLVLGIREIEHAMGSGEDRIVSQGEMINRENLSKSIVAAKSLKKGSVIKKNYLKVLSPGQGLSPQFLDDLVGRTLNRDMNEEDYFYPSDLQEYRIEPRKYDFTMPWGVPVRYHDFAEYYQKIKPDLFEFHLSYSDMEIDVSDYLQGTYNCDFVVHAPELFSGSRLMDLASTDEDYRRFSIQETQKVIEITRSLKKYFPSTKKPLIVTNIGGFSMDAEMSESQKIKGYEIFEKSLTELDLTGVEIIPQTMAPFPWHFGGQRYQNLFVKISEIEEWCKRLNLRMCFDISHTRLTCNHFNYDFYDFCKRIIPISAHLHLGDASGVNGEGLQIGDGDIDFNSLGDILKSSKTSFIPEIWQGHKNGGEGFWIALDKLERYL